MVQSPLPYDSIQLATAVDLVNTYDPWFAEPESLGDTGALAQFLAAHNYGQHIDLDDADLARALSLRSHLRAVFATEDLSLAVRALADAMSGSRVKVEPTVLDSGAASLALTSDAIDPPVARLAADTVIGLDPGAGALRHRALAGMCRQPVPGSIRGCVAQRRPPLLLPPLRQPDQRRRLSRTPPFQLIRVKMDRTG